METSKNINWNKIPKEKLFYLGRVALSGALKGGFHEWRRQRSESLPEIDPELPKWKKELEVIIGLDKKRILKESAKSAVLAAGEKIPFIIMGSQLLRRTN